jgi:hypothetical protein
MVEIFFGILVGLVGCILLHGWMSIHIRRTRMLKIYRGRFFDDVGRLLKADRLTDDQLSRMQRMINDLDSRTVFTSLQQVVTSTHRDLKQNQYGPSGTIVSPEWGELLYNYLLALTYRRSIRGWMVRAMMADILSPRFGSNEAEAIDMRLHGKGFAQRA